MSDELLVLAERPYLSIQGEGPQAGKLSIFVRAGGCDFACSWCDTKYASRMLHKPEWLYYTTDKLVNDVRAFSDKGRVVLTGGNPVLQDFGPMIDTLGWQWVIDLETQASPAPIPAWVKQCETVVVSPKPASSGRETALADVERYLDEHGDRMCLKFVVNDVEDRQYVERVAKFAWSKYPILGVYVQPCAMPDDTPSTLLQKSRVLVRWLQEWGDFRVAMMPQLHRLLWGTGKGV